MTRVLVVATIWLIAGIPVLVRAVGDRPRRRREDVGDVLARVVAATDGPPVAPTTRRNAVPPLWPLFLLSFIATAGAVSEALPVATAGVIGLNLLTVAHAHRARTRALQAALVRRRR